MKISTYNTPSKTIQEVGFTLLELMITIAIMAIIVSLAAPSFSNQLATQRIKTTTSLIQVVLNDAKTESYIRRTPVQVKYNKDDREFVTSISKPVTQDGTTTTVITEIGKHMIDDNTKITVTPTTTDTITFSAKGRTATPVTFLICDKQISDIDGYEVDLNSTAIMSTTRQSGGCS